MTTTLICAVEVASLAGFFSLYLLAREWSGGLRRMARTRFG